MKIYPHVQNARPEIVAAINENPPAYVKQIFYGGDYADLFPDSNTIARHWIGGDDVEGEYISKGFAGGVFYFRLLCERYEALRGKVLAHEGPNEPFVGNAWARKNLSEFYRGWIREMRRYHLRSVSGCFASGTPDVTQPETLRELGWAFGGTYLGLHEYGWPNMADYASWYALRHRFLVQARKDIGLATNPILITECGIDGTAFGQGGWRSSLLNWEQYRDQLRWYVDELEQDRYVKAAFLFNSGGDARWESFEVGPSEIRGLWKVGGQAVAGR